MNAIILAAGKGQRLKSLSLDIPKPMIEINGKPILEHNIKLCRDAGINNIYINTHHFSDKIINYFGDGSRFGVKIDYNHEKEILGTAGALIPFKEKLIDEPFLIIYGDNYINFDLLELKKHSEDKKSDISILFHWRKNIKNSGIALANNNNQITKFIEKPLSSKNSGDWVNAGYYFVSNKKIFNFVKYNSDFGTDLFPILIDLKFKLFMLKTKADLIAIDTPKLYKKNSNK